MVGMLSAAEYISNYLKENEYTLNYTLILVAFDFEEIVSFCYFFTVFVALLVSRPLKVQFSIPPSGFFQSRLETLETLI